MRRDTETEWQAQAACRGADSSLQSLFFPERGENVHPAVRATCDSCPVQVECLRYAMDTHQRFGVWGGLSTRERERFARKRQIEATLRESR